MSDCQASWKTSTNRVTLCAAPRARFSSCVNCASFMTESCWRLWQGCGRTAGCFSMNKLMNTQRQKARMNLVKTVQFCRKLDYTQERVPRGPDDALFQQLLWRQNNVRFSLYFSTYSLGKLQIRYTPIRIFFLFWSSIKKPKKIWFSIFLKIHCTDKTVIGYIFTLCTNCPLFTIVYHC